MNEVIDKG